MNPDYVGETETMVANGEQKSNFCGKNQETLKKKKNLNQVLQVIFNVLR